MQRLEFVAGVAYNKLLKKKGTENADKSLLPGHPPRGIPRPRAERQAWSDKTLLVNACMHLLSKYDFVGVQDFDELLVPSPPFNTLPEVLKVMLSFVLSHLLMKTMMIIILLIVMMMMMMMMIPLPPFNTELKEFEGTSAF